MVIESILLLLLRTPTGPVQEKSIGPHWREREREMQLLSEKEEFVFRLFLFGEMRDVLR